MYRILRDEGGVDIFAVRRWFSDSDEEDVDSRSDESEDDMDLAIHR